MGHFQRLALATALAVMLSFCGGIVGTPPANTTATPAPPTATAPAAAPPPSAAPPPPDPACACTPADETKWDYRHAAKHVPLAQMTPLEISVTDMLGWPHATSLPKDAPRTGRELQLFHIAKAYLQTVWVEKGDCDIHMEISAAADATAPRVIVETPIDAVFCPARASLAAALQAKGLPLTIGTVSSLPVEVTGMAFQDYEHARGSSYVSTPWELHPAEVSLLP